MRTRRRLSDAQIAQIKALAAAGLTPRAIASSVGCDRTTAARVLTRFLGRSTVDVDAGEAGAAAAAAARQARHSLCPPQIRAPAFSDEWWHENEASWRAGLRAARKVARQQHGAAADLTALARINSVGRETSE